MAPDDLMPDDVMKENAMEVDPTQADVIQEDPTEVDPTQADVMQEDLARDDVTETDDAALEEDVTQDGPSTDTLTLLEQQAIAVAVEQRAVPLRDGEWDDPDRYALPEQLVVAWQEPPVRPRYGAFVPPLMAPHPGALSARGVVWCPGSSYAYMGFEADRSQPGTEWAVFPVSAD